MILILMFSTETNYTPLISHNYLHAAILWYCYFKTLTVKNKTQKFELPTFFLDHA